MKKNIFYSLIITVAALIAVLLLPAGNVYAGTNAWRNFNDNDGNISYGGRVYAERESQNYAGTYHGFRKDSIGATAKFNFTGNKLRIWGLVCSSYTTRVSVKIDGTEYTFSAYSSSSHYNTVLFEKTDLLEGEHTAVITNVHSSGSDTNDFRIDEISTDSDDILLPYNENCNRVVYNVWAEEVPHVNDEFTADLLIDNVEGIKSGKAAIKFDASRLEYIGCESAEGLKIGKCLVNNNAGTINVIFTAKTLDDYINSRRVAAKFKFKAKASGAAKVSVTGGATYNGTNRLKVISNADCGYKVIDIR